MERYRKSLGIVALVGFSMALCVHVLALLGSTWLLKIPGVMFLHVGIFVVFIPMVLSMGPYQKKIKQSKLGIWSIFPIWMRAILFGLTLYTAANFMLFAGKSGGGGPAEKNGGYVIQNHGKLIRKITKQEYDALRVNEVRGFSGHWLLFYGVPMFFFLFVPALKDKEEEEGERKGR
ncbi:MAG: hypothetical protein H6728_14845 [Myxococcales bacterium]|nr:hypothetical protein [Myxococcales bacterium]MCB9644347.1 hypothetical protein [Myxococcales bacterium]